MASSRGSRGASERPPYVGPTADYHNANQALERAEYEADVDHHKRRNADDRSSLIERLKALLRPGR